jgi:hypothetical protein
MDPGSAAHRHSASKTRVNAPMALRNIPGHIPHPEVRALASLEGWEFVQSRYECMIEGQQEVIMNEDVFNASLRKFLKKVGITSQREIEKAVRDAVESGRLKGNEKLPAKMVLTVGGVNLTHEVKDEIELG